MWRIVFGTTRGDGVVPGGAESGEKMSAKTDVLHDIANDNRACNWAMMSRDEQRDILDAQRAAFLTRYKETLCDVRPIRAVAKMLERTWWQIRNIVVAGKVWSGRANVRSERNNRSYSVITVDVDEVRRYYAAQVERAPREQKVFEKPPAGMVTISDLCREFAALPNSLTKWARDKEMPGKKYVVHGARSGWQWYVYRADALALLKKKLVGRHGKNMRRDTSVPVTPLIRELWGMEEEIRE